MSACCFSCVWAAERVNSTDDANRTDKTDSSDSSDSTGSAKGMSTATDHDQTAISPWKIQAVAFAAGTNTQHSTDSDDTLSSSKLGAELRAWYPLGTDERAWIGVGIGSSLMSYHDTLGIDRPLSALWVRGASIIFMTDWLAISSQLALGVAGESGANELFQYRFTIGPQVFTAADRSVFLGVLVRSQAYTDLQILPLVTVDWRFNNVLQLQLFDQIDELSRLRYKCATHFEANLRMDVALRSFALDADQGTPVAMTDQSVAVGFEGGYFPTETDNHILRLHAGMVVVREIELLNAKGDAVQSRSFDPGLMLGGSYRVTF